MHLSNLQGEILLNVIQITLRINFKITNKMINTRECRFLTIYNAFEFCAFIDDFIIYDRLKFNRVVLFGG